MWVAGTAKPAYLQPVSGYPITPAFNWGFDCPNWFVSRVCSQGSQRKVCISQSKSSECFLECVQCGKEPRRDLGATSIVLATSPWAEGVMGEGRKP